MQGISNPQSIAMWSGPRNISTALMRAFENRSDCEVLDEPLYGHYLHKTGINHPGADEVIAAQGIDWQNIVNTCVSRSPEQKPLFYQKHMTLHLPPEMDKNWLSKLTNCFLIREPERVIASYAAVREQPTLDDIGFRQQARLFDYVVGNICSKPLVIDSKSFLQNPEPMLREICRRLDITFEPGMLSWKTGARASDGVWAKYWYDSVWKSSGFSRYTEKPLNLNNYESKLAEQARPYFDRLFAQRVQI